MSIKIPDEIQMILDKIKDYRIKNNCPKDDKVESITEYEINHLPKIPENWTWVVSNDISTFITNGVHSPTSPVDKLGIKKKMLRITDIDEANTADFRNLPYCTRFVKGDYDKTLAKNDIYISFTGNILGKRYLVKKSLEDVVFAHYFVRWQPIVVDPHYIYYVLLSRHFDRFMHAHTLGSTQPNLKVTELKRVPLPIAPLPEQIAIASILSSLDSKIELLLKQNQTLENIAQTLFNRWFIDFEFPNEDGKPYKSSGGNMVDSQSGEIPEGWRIGRINHLVEILSGFAFKSRNFIENGQHRIVTIRNVQDGFFEQNTKDGLDKLPAKLPEYCLLKNGDILISLTGNVGRVCHVIGNNYLLNQRVAKLQPAKNHDYAYVYLFFRQKSFLKLLENISSGTAQQNLSPVQTGNLEVIIYKREVLDKFGAIANSIFDKVIQNKTQIQTLTKTRDTLLPKLMSGQIRVKTND